MTNIPLKTVSKNGLVFITSTAGHRQNYLEVLSELMGYKSYVARPSIKTWLRLIRSETLLFATAEDDLKTFFVVSITRLLLKKKTTALFMGPGRCFEKGAIKYSLKRLAFNFLNKFSAINLLSILPFYLDARFSQVARDWIYDPQFWDLKVLIASGDAADTDISARCRLEANGRPILLFLGSPSKIKGFPFLANTILASPSLAENLLIVVAGKVPECYLAIRDRLESLGVLFIDRYLTEDEVVSLKFVSNTIWACYHPSYNSSSGVFGRALQLDKNVIVRRGSLIDEISRELSYPIMTCDFDDIPQCIAQLSNIQNLQLPHPRNLSQIFYARSVRILKK